MERKLRITVGSTSRGGQVKKREVTWSHFAHRFSQFKELDLSIGDYLKLSVDEKGDLKDKSGFFIGGYFSDDTRKKAALLGRSLLTLDVDNLPADKFPHDVERAFKGFAYAFHTSASHTPQKPKFRLVFPLSRDTTVAEYEPLARMVASWLSIEAVDRVSYRPSQLMYMPMRCTDSEFASTQGAGDYLDPDLVLGHYENWQDFKAWPCSAADKEVRMVAQKMEDPCTKGGAIGAFCLAFDIHQAIEQFKLPYVPTEHENRYTPEGATGSQGAVVYPSETCEAAFLYSHHSHDPAANKCLNSWDLVRLCKFAGMAEVDSQKEMLTFARSLDAVKDVVEERISLDDFDEIDPESGEQVKAPVLNYDYFADAISAIDNGFEHHAAEPDWFREQSKQFLTRLSAARLDPSDEDVLLGLLRNLFPKPKPSKDRLHGDLKKLRKQHTGAVEGADGELADIEIEIIGEVLKRYYKGGEHIRRVGQQFWIYDRGCWRTTEDEQVKGRLLSTISSLRVDRPEDLMTLVAAVGESATSAIVGRLFSIFPSFVARKNNDRDPLGLKKSRNAIVNCLNGELHLDEHGIFDLRPHDPDNFLTSQIPVVYDPDALCPTWDDFCAYIFQDAIDPRRMQEHIEELGGYLIQPTRWLRTWVLLHGRTGTGKTTIGNVFTNLLGDAAAARPLNSYDGSNSHAEAGLVGKLMLLDEDFAKGAILPDGFLKKISEAKTLTANPKNKAEFSFVCRSLPIILSNSWPVTRDMSDALIDRALIWHFERQFSGVTRDDKKADTMTTKELPGIMNRFLSGFERLRKRGSWDAPIECIMARETWTIESNSVGRFISECIETLPASKKAKVPGNDLWNAYRAWMSEAMPDTRRIGRNEFYERCRQMLGPMEKLNGERIFRDCALRKEVVADFD